MELSVCIGNLGRYNEGYSAYEWLEFPFSDIDFSRLLAKIGIGAEPDEYGNIYEEWFVADVDTDMPEIAKRIGDHPTKRELEEWSDFMELMADCDPLMDKAVDALIGEGYDIKEISENMDAISIYEANTDAEFAVSFIEEHGGARSYDAESLALFFDYEKYGRDLMITGEIEHGGPPYSAARKYLSNYGGAQNLDKATLEYYLDYGEFGKNLLSEGDFAKAKGLYVGFAV